MFCTVHRGSLDARRSGGKRPRSGAWARIIMKISARARARTHTKADERLTSRRSSRLHAPWKDGRSVSYRHGYARNFMHTEYDITITITCARVAVSLFALVPWPYLRNPVHWSAARRRADSHAGGCPCGVIRSVASKTVGAVIRPSIRPLHNINESLKQCYTSVCNVQRSFSTRRAAANYICRVTKSVY